MKVSQVPFDRIHIGDQVLSYIGNFGRVVEKWIDHRGRGKLDLDNYWIRIDWSTGNKSYQQHNDLVHVTYLGELRG